MMNRYRSKYGAKKVTIDGVTFDSKKEARRFNDLTQLARAGQIVNLRRQVKFVLIPAQTKTIERFSVKTGKRLKDKVVTVEHECSYIADFVYEVPISTNYINEEGHLVFADGFETVVEDTKGFKTKDYIIKRKLMLHVHGIRIKEI